MGKINQKAQGISPRANFAKALRMADRLSPHADGDTTEIESEAGQIIGIARAEDRLRHGVVSMTHMFGTIEPSTNPRQQRGSNVGSLTSLDRYLEPINFMPRFSGVPINIRPASASTKARPNLAAVVP